MKNLNLSKKMNSTIIATIIMTVLLVSSIFVVFASAEIGGSSRTTKDLEARVDPVTGMPYGNLTQYEWVSAGNGGENTRYSAGPAPNNPILKWSQFVGSAGGFGGAIPTAYNGMVFAYGPNIKAFNATTGQSVFNASMNGSFPGFGANDDIVKFSDDLWGYLSTTGVVWYNFSIPDAGVTKTPMGKTAINVNTGAYGFTSIGTAGTAMYWGSMYDYESKTYISVAINSQNGRPVAVAFDCSDIPNQGAPIKWITSLDSGLEALGFGGGNAYIGGYAEGEVYALDIDTGDVVWKQYKAGNAGYSITYYDGVVYHSASSTQITAFDGATGAVLKVFDVAGGRAFFSYGGAAAYGMYFDSSIQIPQGWTSAWNAKSLEQLWKQPSEYYIKYLVGVVGDGKFITTTNDVARGNTLPGGASISDGFRVTAFDVFTGQQVWNLATSGSVLEPCIAYGNLYMIYGQNLYCYSDDASTPDGTSGWPFYHGATYAAGTVTGQYPTNVKVSAWDFQADSPSTGSVVAAEGKVVFGTFAGTWYCVDANTADELWTFHVDAKIYSTAAIVNGTVYTGSDDGKVYALNATTGAKIWERYVGGVTQGALQTSALQTNPSPVVYNNRVLIGAQDGNLYCLNAVTGQVIWLRNIATQTQGIGGAVAIVPQDLLGRTQVLIVANASVYQINFANGAVINRTSLTGLGASATRDYCTPTVVGNFVFINSGSGNGYMSMFNSTSMARIVTVRLDKGSGSTPTTTSPCYIPNLTVELKNGANIGYNTTNTAQTAANRYILNLTTPTTTRVFNVVVTVEAQEASAWALIPNGTNLGTGTSQATRWIVNATTSYYMVRLWSNWVGHQSLASPVVAINSQTPGANAIVYEGNSVYGFTAYNCTSGAILSTYTATAQVFNTPALYNNRVYFADSAGILHCIVNDDPQFSVSKASIYASSNKGAEMYSNEPMLVEGRLSATQTFDSELVNAETYSPPLPYTTVSFTFVNPDQTTETMTTTTDANGSFNFTVTPTQTGQASWLVYFDGMQTLDGQYMDGAYSTYTTIDVVSPNGPDGSTSTPTPPVDNTPIAMEYIIAAIVAVIVVVAVIAAIVVMRRKK